MKVTSWFTLVHSVGSGPQSPFSGHLSQKCDPEKGSVFRSVNPEAERARIIPGTLLKLGPRVSTLGPGELLAEPYDPDLRGITCHNPAAIPVVATTYAAGSRPPSSEVLNLL